MERTLTIGLDKARSWYNSSEQALRDIALAMFTERELLGEKEFKRQQEEGRRRYEEYRKMKSEASEEYSRWRREEEYSHW